METKDQTNQNPEKEKQIQEENSTSLKKEVTNSPNSDAEKAEMETASIKPEEKADQVEVQSTEPNPEIKESLKAEEPDNSEVKAEIGLEKEEEENPVPETIEPKNSVGESETKESGEEKNPKKAKPVESESQKDEPSNEELSAEIPADEHEDEDEEEDEHDSEIEEVDEVVNYDEASREELLVLLEKAVNEGEISKIKRKVALIKVAFLKQTKEDTEKAYEKYLADGGDAEEFNPDQDPLVGKFNEYFNIYKRNRNEYLKELEKIKIKNLEAKKLILEELKILIDSDETLKKTYDEFKTLQDKWKAIGMVPKGEVNNLWQSYHFFVEKFFDKVKINRELRDLDLKKNLELKMQLCEKTEELLLETSIIKSFKQLQLFHQQWKETGPVAQDKKDEIWERFKDATDKINQRRKEHYNDMQEEQNSNLTAKTALCEKAEELLQLELTTIKEWQAKTEEISELLKVWKTIGPAPRKNNDEIWTRFKSSLDAFFAAKKEYFQKIKDEQLNNYNLKLELCVQAEAFQSSTDWKQATRDLIALQKEWKAIGPVPRKNSDKIWKRFRAACDVFFNNKSEYFSNINKHESDNLKLKTELIQKVEKYEFGTDKTQNLNAIKDFQREWTGIGHVPIKEKDKIHNEFRNAINQQLDKLNISKTELQTINYKSKVEGFKENPNAKRIISSERIFLMNKRKKMEEEINLWENNLGFFAESKQASLLKQEFEKKIATAKREIEILNAKIKMLNKED
jgi:hypothetical protein